MILAESLWTAVDALDRDATVVVLPVARVSPQGDHLPLGANGLLANSVARSASDLVPGTLVLPLLPYAPDLAAAGFAGATALSPEGFLGAVRSVLAPFASAGFRRFVLLLGPGGDDGLARAAAAAIRAEDRSILIAVLDPFGEAPRGGRQVTSMLLAVRHDRVGVPTPDGLRAPEGPAGYVATLHELSERGGEADPSGASAPAGLELLALAVETAAEAIRRIAVPVVFVGV